MALFDRVKGMLGIISVREQNGLITVTGTPSRFIQYDIDKLWGTSKIAKYMFKNVKPSEFSFHSFFALEVVYMFEKMIEDKTRYCSRRVLQRIVDLIKENTWMKDLDEPWGDILDIRKTSPIIYKLKDHQAKFLQYYNYTKPRYRLKGALFAGDPGSGKALKLDALIKTPTGWIRNGDITVGTIVSTPDGSEAPVIGVYPQGEKEVYRVTFKDGRTADCCGEHLWTINQGTSGTRMKEMTVNTVELQRLLAIKDSRVSVQLIVPKDEPAVDHLIHPYAMGLLLGDGGMTEHSLRFHKPDPELEYELRGYLHPSLTVNRYDQNSLSIIRKPDVVGHVWMEELHRLELWGCRSWEKFIPNEYLTGTVQQRLAIVQGMMDTDGYVDMQSTASYCTTSLMMARQFQYLIHSLGGIAKISVKKPFYTYKGERLEGRTAYNVHIRYKKPSELFRLPRKKERCNDEGQYCEGLRLAITGVVKTNEVEPMQCIEVDHPDHLYIIDDFVVTHNTLGGIATMFARDKDYVFIVSPKKAIYDVWEKTLKELVTGNQSVWVADTNTACPKGAKWMIFHYERLEQAVQMAKQLNLPNVGIILDESHNLNLKSKESIRTTQFGELCATSKSEDILWLSGTALTAMGSEAIPLFRTLIPDFTPEVEFAMRKIWGKVGGKANDILANRLGIVSFLVPKDSFMSDKPIEATVKVKIPNAQRYTLEAIRTLMVSFIKERFDYYTKNRPRYQQIYDDAMLIHGRQLRTPRDHELFKQYKDNVAMFQKYGFDPRTMSDESKYCNDYELNVIIPCLPESLRAPFKDARSVIKYVDLKIKGECLGRILGKERTQCHVDMVRYIPFQQYIDNAKKKTVVFTDFVPVLEETRKFCTELGYMPVVVYGDTNNDLVNIVKDFRANEDINPCIATFRSLAEAVPLTEANNGMMLNKPFRFHHYKQAMARMHRLGQDTTVYINNFVLDTGNEPNISTRSEDIMNWSRDQVDQLMGYDRYGSTVDVPDVEGVGTEGLDGQPPFDPDEGFLSAGNEAFYNYLEDEGFIVEDPPTEVPSSRAKVLSW